MKNWDIISPYMSDNYNVDANWFLDSVKYGIGKDMDT